MFARILALVTFAATKTLLPLLLLLLFRGCGGSSSRNGDLYLHVESLDSIGNYVLEWRVDWEEGRIYFKTIVATRGFILFGLSRSSSRNNNSYSSLEDIIIGGVDTGGRPYFQDYHRRPGDEAPFLDQLQNWRFIAANNNATHSWIYFSRLLDTCDKRDDVEISDDSRSLLWGYGKGQYDGGGSNANSFKLEASGVFYAYLLDPEYSPLKQTSRTSSGADHEEDHTDLGNNTSLLRIRTSVVLPPKKTTYWCTLHKISLPRKHHIIGLGIRSNHDSRWDLHHLIIHQCQVPPDANPGEGFEPFLRYKGEECHRPAFHKGVLPYGYCRKTVYGAAIGERSTFFPDHVGLPIGTHSEEYYLIQVHYENEWEEKGIRANLELELFYTSNLRKYDGGMFAAGSDVPGSPSLLVPPNSPSHRIYGHCSSGCTLTHLPPSGVKLFGGLLHSHKSGRALRVRHFRGEAELPWILNDDSYNSRFQPIRLLHEEVDVLPGDQLSVGCTLDTSSRNWTTVGGFPADHEMCLAFLFYYPSLEGFGVCRSEIRSEEYNMRYLGITANNVTWDSSQLEYLTLAPLSRSGLTISQVSDQFVKWDAGLRRALQRDHIFYPQRPVCPKFNSSYGLLLPHDKPLKSVAIPGRVSKYGLPPRKC